MNNTDFRLRARTAEMLTERKAAVAGGFIRHMVKKTGIGGLVSEYGGSDQSVHDLREWSDRKMRGEPHAKAAVGRFDATEFLPPSVTAPIIELEASRGIVSRLGSPLVPFNVQIPIEDIAPTATRLQADGDFKPVSAGSFSTNTLTRKSVVALIVVTQELDRFGIMGDAHRARMLSRALRTKTDSSFMASLIASTTATAGQGDLALDLMELLRAYQGPVETALLIMSSRNAIAAHCGGNSAFKDLGATGGFAAGVPVIASDTAGDTVALVDSSRILIGDQGEMDIRLGRHASITMDDSGSPVSTEQVHMFQSNSIAVLAERYIDWAFGVNAVEHIADVDYATTGSPA